MEKTTKIDAELRNISNELGMTFNGLSRIALIEYLQNHFQLKIGTELYPAKNSNPVSQLLSQDD